MYFWKIWKLFSKKFFLKFKNKPCRCVAGCYRRWMQAFRGHIFERKSHIFKKNKNKPCRYVAGCYRRWMQALRGHISERKSPIFEKKIKNVLFLRCAPERRKILWWNAQRAEKEYALWWNALLWKTRKKEN